MVVKAIDLPRATEDADHARRLDKLLMNARRQTQGKTANTDHQLNAFVKTARGLSCDDPEPLDKALKRIAAMPPPEFPRKRKAPKKRVRR